MKKVLAGRNPRLFSDLAALKIGASNILGFHIAILPPASEIFHSLIVAFLEIALSNLFRDYAFIAGNRLFENNYRRCAINMGYQFFVDVAVIYAVDIARLMNFFVSVLALVFLADYYIFSHFKPPTHLACLAPHLMHSYTINSPHHESLSWHYTTQSQPYLLQYWRPNAMTVMIPPSEP